MVGIGVERCLVTSVAAAVRRLGLSADTNVTTRTIYTRRTAAWSRSRRFRRCLEFADAKYAVETIEAMDCRSILAAQTVQQGGGDSLPVTGNQCPVHQAENQNILVCNPDGTRVTMAYNPDFRRVQKES